MMSLAPVIHVLPDGPVGVAEQPTDELLKAYSEVWRVMGLLGLIRPRQQDLGALVSP